ncbi:glycosyltransferase family 2 protein [Paraglaciecola sp. 25GB23A]|uniref:glycosyltransferase family 2 protein n=1 Tax=Paraglaciecola sp. 25GB23A TaxID=3156068 RepID=UPI0032AEAA5E
MEKINMQAAALMMQKNERELLAKWIVYHSAILGLENLYVFDNGSDDKNTITLLKDWEAKGLEVYWDFNTKQDFENKGTILGDKIKQLDERGKHDCYLPLDCDEFLAVRLENGGFSCEASNILGELARYVDSENVLLIDAQFFNSPISNSWFHRYENRKVLFMKNTFQSMDVGFHWGKVKNSEVEIKTNLVHFHFHYKPFVFAQEYARNKLALRVKSFEIDYLATYKGPGEHLTKYFLLSEKEYLKQVLVAPHFNITVLAEKFDELGIAWPYLEYMERSLHALDESADFANSDTVKNLHRVADHRFRGSVDQVIFNDDTLRIDGWSAEMNSLPICNFVLVGSSGELDIVADENVFRPDIAKLLGFEKRNFGFVLRIAKSTFESINASQLILLPKLQSGEVGPALSINRKYIDLVSSVLV